MSRKKRNGIYGRLYADILTDPKFLELMTHGNSGRIAFGSYCLALAWSSLHKTDGFVPASALPTLHLTKAQAGLLVDCGLWQREGRDYQISGYLAANNSRAEIDALARKGEVNACHGRMKHGSACSCGAHQGAVTDLDTHRMGGKPSG